MAEPLPIYAIERDIVEALSRAPRLILSAPAGSGKSTQVPQMLLKHRMATGGQIILLQPRRLAARLLAARVAFERKARLGDEVGYQIRFDDLSSERTRIKFVTEGILLRQMLQEPALPGVDVLIFDEFHERHLYGDITLAQALKIQKKDRPDLKIVMMSATLELERLEEYLEPCQVLVSEGRQFPVEIRYAARPAYVDSRPVWEQAAAAFATFVDSGGGGDVLIFMPGGYEIARTLDALRRLPQSRGFVLLPLHGELPAQQQDAAVARYEEPKVIVSTNVAETSLTIDGVRCVIDSGLARIARHDPHRGINTLLIEKISRAAADQRAGRAGRTAPGVCMRLWSEAEHAHRPAHETPEIKRLDLSEAVLMLKTAGVENVSRFHWLEPPEEQALAHAEELLQDLGAIRAAEQSTSHTGVDSHASPRLVITNLGRQMLAFPLHPRYARMLLAAQDFGCVYEACLVAALTQGRELLERKPDPAAARRRDDLVGDENASDFRVLMRAWNYAVENRFQADACARSGIHSGAARQIDQLFQHFLSIARREGLEISRREAPEWTLRKCLLVGFSDRIARRLEPGSSRCELVHGRRGTLARETVVRQSPLLVVAEVSEIGSAAQGVDIRLSLATAIEQEWLEELFPHDLARASRTFYDPATRRIYAEEEIRFRQLIIGSRRVEPSADAAAKLLANEIIAGRLALDEWDESVEQWILRLNLLRQWCPELALPELGPDERRHLLEQLCHGSFSHKEIKSRPVKSLVKSWLSVQQQELLEKHAPETLRLMNGRQAKIVYQSGGAPHIALRIQQLFGQNATPRLGMGRVAVVVHVLAPNMRPVQITTDLAGFWREHYPRIKQELQRKYPKHDWRTIEP